MAKLATDVLSWVVEGRAAFGKVLIIYHGCLNNISGFFVWKIFYVNKVDITVVVIKNTFTESISFIKVCLSYKLV